MPDLIILIHAEKSAALHEEVSRLFEDAQLEMVHCGLCGEYHPPELHTPITPWIAEDPPEA